MDPLSGSCPLTRNKRATRLRIADLGRVVALTTGMLLFKLTFLPTSTTLELELFNCVLFYRTNSNSVSFSQSQCCRLLRLLLTRFSSEVDVVRRSRSITSFELTIISQVFYRVVSIFDVRMKFLS